MLEHSSNRCALVRNDLDLCLLSYGILGVSTGLILDSTMLDYVD